MKGTILSFDKDNNSGLISGHDGKRYEFVMLEWKDSKRIPSKGQTVDFEIDKDNEKKAKDIIFIKGTGNGKTKIAAALFAFFLGGFGAHKFYLGQIGWGFLYLVFFWTLIPSVIAFIEFILLLAMSDDKFDEKYNS